jgi:hypothetical protein
MVPSTHEKSKGHLQRLERSDGRALGRTVPPDITSFELYCPTSPTIVIFVVGVATGTLGISRSGASVNFMKTPEPGLEENVKMNESQLKMRWLLFLS